MDLVPKEYVIRTLNEKAVLALAKTGMKIPGVRFWEEFNVSIGQKSRVPRAALE